MCLVERSGFGLNALLGPKVGLGHGNTLLPEERELIKVASLEDDLVVAHMEETAPTQASWITPFKNGPFSVLEDVLDYAGHGCPPELNLEHLSAGLTTDRKSDEKGKCVSVRVDLGGRLYIKTKKKT